MSSALTPRLPFSPSRFLVFCSLAFLLTRPSSGIADTVYGFGGQFVDGYVFTTTYFNGDLIAGGAFGSAGGVAGSKCLARWNGTEWVGMDLPGAEVLVGAGQGTVEALVVHEGELYVAGQMMAAAGAPSDHIIRWDGMNWKAVGTGVGADAPGFEGRPSALLSSGKNLYAGGEFLTAGNKVVNRVAKWDGHNWKAMGKGLDNSVVSLVEYNGEIIAGGYFTFDGLTVAGVAAWNGHKWHRVGQDLGAGVHDLAVFNGVLVAGGEFTLDGGSYLAWLDGDTWRPLGGGTGGYVEALTVAGDRLYVAGGFFDVGDRAALVPARFIASWDGTTWSNAGSGIADPHASPSIFDLASNGSEVVVAGSFSIAGDLDAPNLAIWNGSAWNNEVSNCGNGLNGPPNAFLTSSDGSLIVGGNFTRAGGVAANRIARWDGTWHAYGDGLDSDCCQSQVNALAEWNGTIIAAGSFNISGSQSVIRIAQWDGTEWVPLGSGLGGALGTVITAYALAVYNGDVVVGGLFTIAGGQAVNRIARWDGTSWHAMGGFNNAVQVLTVYNGELYAGGNFSLGGGFAKWNGSTWVGIGVQGPLVSMTISGGILYVSGPNTLQGWNGTTLSSVPRPTVWDGGIADNFGTLAGTGGLSLTDHGVLGAVPGMSWYMIAEAAGRPLFAANRWPMLAHDGSFVKGLFVGGDFVRMGGVPSCRIALINPEFKTPPIQQENRMPSIEASVVGLQAAPNPFQHSLAIRFALKTASQVQVIVLDLQGRIVANVVDQALPSGRHEASWDARDVQGRRVPPGVYFVRARYGDRTESKQVVLLK